MRQQVSNPDVLLPVGRELRPVRRDSRVEVEQAAIGHHQRGQARHGLGARPDIDDGFLDRDRGAHLCIAAEFFGQRVGDLVEPGVDVAVRGVSHRTNMPRRT